MLLSAFETFGQEKAIKIYPTAGITWRSTAMNFFNFKAVIPDDPTKPYSYEKNVQGFSLNPGIQFLTKSIGLEYYPNLRYDVVHYILAQTINMKRTLSLITILISYSGEKLISVWVLAL